MSRPFSTRRRERIGKTGAVLLNANQLCFLHGLLDRPNATALGVDDLIRASTPYVFRFRSYISVHCLRKSLRRMPTAWLIRLRVGRYIAIGLSPRGRAIVERTVPAHLIGHGPYEGLPPRTD